MDKKQEQIKEIKKNMLAADCNKTAVRAWFKLYDKTLKKAEDAKEEYQKCLHNTMIVQEYGKQMEQFMVQKAVPDRENRLRQFGKDFKRIQGAIAHEFIISSQNQEFFSTYQSLQKLLKQPLNDHHQELILHSEIENLLALLAEGLALEKPHFFALGFFHMEHTDQELYDMPSSEKRQYILNLYEKGFLLPIRRELFGAMGKEQLENLLQALCKV